MRGTKQSAATLRGRSHGYLSPMSPVCRPCPLGQENKPYGPWDKSKEQRYRKVRSASDHRKEGDDDVSCVPSAYRVSRSVAQPWVAQPWTLGQEQGAEISSSRLQATLVRSIKPSPVAFSSLRPPLDGVDVSCVPIALRWGRSHGPWDKSKEQRYRTALYSGGVVCEDPMSPVCRSRIAYPVARIAYPVARIAYPVAWPSHGWRSHGWRSHGPWDKSKEQRYRRQRCAHCALVLS